MEQVGLLRDDADGRGERREARVAHVDAVDRDAPGLRLVQARDEVAERRLAGAGRADERGARARGDDEVDVVQRPRRALVVAEADALEAHLAEHLLGAQLDGVGGLDDVDRQVEVLEDAVEERERGLDVGADAEAAGAIGKSRRVCSVVNATTVPRLIAVPRRGSGRRPSRRSPAGSRTPC